MTYSFDGVELPIVSSAIVPLASRVASADTPARAGGYTGIRRTAARTATVLGTLKSTDFETLKSDWADLQAAHDIDTPRQLVVRDGWFYYATPDNLTESDMEATSLHYQADYKLGDPYAYSQTLNTASLATSGTTVVTAGGTRDALPTITLYVSSIGTDGQIVLANNTTGQQAYVKPSVPIEYIFNSRTELVETGQPSVLSGEFLGLAVGANNISVTCSNGASLSSASISWRNRSL